MSKAIFFLFIVVLVLCVIGAIAKSKSEKKRPVSGREFAPRQLMSETEAKFFRQLVRALPDEWIFPQVAMSALIKPKARGKGNGGSFWTISQKRVDFVVYRADLKLITVIELDDHSHDRKRDDDAQRDGYLRSAGVRTVRFDVRAWPDDVAIRAEVYPQRPAPSLDTTKPAHAPVPAAIAQSSLD